MTLGIGLSMGCLWVGGVLIGVGSTMLWKAYHSYDFTAILWSLHGAKYCMTHDVMDTTKASEVEYIDILIEELEGR